MIQNIVDAAAAADDDIVARGDERVDCYCGSDEVGEKDDCDSMILKSIHHH